MKTITRRKFGFKRRTAVVLAAAALQFLARAAAAAPAITATQGTFGNNQTFQIDGSNFGSKSPAAPTVWADFNSSLNPSSLGQKKSWGNVRSMRWTPSGKNGGGAESSDSLGYWALGADDTWTQDSQKVYVFRQTKRNFLISGTGQNWKSWRMWPSGSSGNYPNVYIAPSNGRVYVEGVGSESGYWGSFKIPSTNWVTEEIIMKASSSSGAKDGLLVVRYDGVEKARGSLMTRSSSGSGLMTRNYVVHEVAANIGTWSPSWSASNHVWADNVYADKTWSRVMLGNAPTFSACTQLEIQIPTAWSNSSVNVQVNTGSFGSGSKGYLYVFDSNNTMNTVGYPVTIGDGSSPPPPDNQSPSVSAGGDQVLIFPAQANLNGTVTDDGLPNPPHAVSTNWTVVSGPGSVTLGNAASLNTTASFPVVGTYKLRLTANDGESFASNDVVINVQSALTPGIPRVVSIAGSFATGHSVQITGTDFGQKVPAQPLVWADFDQSVNPTNLGIKTAWDEARNMGWSSEGNNGTKGVKALDGAGDWALRADYNAWSKNGQKMYVYRQTRSNFLVTDPSQLWKAWQVSPSGGSSPELYAAPSNGRVYVNGIGTESGFWGSFRVPTTNWTTEELITQASSAPDLKDGSFELRYDGKQMAQGTILTRSGGAPQMMVRNYVVYGHAGNKPTWKPAWSFNNRYWVDNVYVDTTWSRVMMGDAPTYAACTQFHMEIPSAWSDTSITVTANTGMFPVGSAAYLYVFDQQGNVNANGYPVTVTAPIAAAMNQAITAGSDKGVNFPSVVSLQGAILNVGGQKTPEGPTVQWTKVSGPGSVTFSDSSNLSTNAGFSAEGVYTLRLSVKNGLSVYNDDVTVAVNSDPSQNGAVFLKNVFNPSRGEDVKFVYELLQASHLSAIIYDRYGERIRTLVQDDFPKGKHIVAWDGRNENGSVVASGVYVVLNQVNDQRSRSKVVVLK